MGRVLHAALMLAVVACFAAQALAAPPPEVPVKGTVTMVDLGAKACIPCKMMIPVMESLEKDYAGKAAIVFIDVWENPEQSKAYGIRAIPTQIFYGKDGKETYRHEGFFDTKSIAEILDRLLAQ